MTMMTFSLLGLAIGAAAVVAGVIAIGHETGTEPPRSEVAVGGREGERGRGRHRVRAVHGGGGSAPGDGIEGGRTWVRNHPLNVFLYLYPAETGRLALHPAHRIINYRYHDPSGGSRARRPLRVSSASCSVCGICNS